MFLPNNAAGRFHLACPAWLLKNDTSRHLAIRIGRYCSHSALRGELAQYVDRQRGHGATYLLSHVPSVGPTPV